MAIIGTLFMTKTAEKPYEGVPPPVVYRLQPCLCIFLVTKMNSHIEESCPHTKVECTFAHIGCKVKVRYKLTSLNT